MLKNMKANNLDFQLQTEEISQIAKILEKEGTLVREWNYFCHTLGVADSALFQSAAEFYRGNSSAYDLFVTILETWQQQKCKLATASSLCESLRQMHRISAAESVQKAFLGKNSSERIPLWPLFYNVGQLNEHFVGRSKQLFQLSSEKIVLISGLGGIGKTELTRKFSHDMYKKSYLRLSCTWFNSETPESLNQSLICLADKIGIRTTNQKQEIRKTSDLFKDLYECITNNKESASWLVVFDNVDDFYPDLQACIQLLTEAEKTQTIVTSRNQSMAKEDWKLILLKEWKIAEAIEFVKGFLSIDTDQEDELISDLCGKLGNHALSIQNAAAYIIQQQRISGKGIEYCISEFLIKVDEHEWVKSRSFARKLSQISNKLAKTTFVTCNITITNLKATPGEIGKLAYSILTRIAYFDPNNIPVDFLEKVVVLSQELLHVSSLAEEKAMIMSALRLLEAYSLIKVENSVIKVHRLVQETIRIALNLANEEEPLLNSLIGAISFLSSFSRVNMNQELTVWKYSSTHGNLIVKYPDMAIQIFNRLIELRMFSEIFNFCYGSHKNLIKALGPNHSETLKMKRHLANILNDEGRNY